MGWFTTPTPRTSAGWTASGACTSGSTARPRGGTKRGSGGAAMTSTTRDEHDADARTDMARRGVVVPGHVGRDDGRDDAAVPGPDALALPPGRPRPDDRARGRRLLRRLDRLRDVRLFARRRAAAPRPDRGRRRRVDGRPSAVHRLEGTSSRLLPGRSYARPDRLATRPEPRSPLQSVLPRSDGDSPGSRGHGPARDGDSGGGHHRRTSRTGPSR